MCGHPLRVDSKNTVSTMIVYINLYTRKQRKKPAKICMEGGEKGGIYCFYSLNFGFSCYMATK